MTRNWHIGERAVCLPWLLLLALVAALLWGCKGPRYVYVTARDTVRTERVRSDTVAVERWRDRWLRGDTVVVRDSVVLWRSRTVADTVYVAKAPGEAQATAIAATAADAQRLADACRVFFDMLTMRRT